MPPLNSYSSYNYYSCKSSAPSPSTPPFFSPFPRYDSSHCYVLLPTFPLGGGGESTFSFEDKILLQKMGKGGEQLLGFGLIWAWGKGKTIESP